MIKDFYNGFKTNVNSKYLKYWHGRYNLGDVFSDYLLDYFYDKNLLDQISNRRILMFIGSEIPTWVDNSHLVCGLGWRQKNAFLQNTNVNKAIFCYVRGKISRQRVIDSGIDIPNDLPIGDTGLLASLLYKPTSEKKYDIGIIIHWSAKPRLEQYLNLVQSKFPNKNIAIMQMGDEAKSPLDLFDFIQSCRLIVASSLHAIIFSHSYGIPALFFSDVDGYKFQDYYSIYDRINYQDLMKYTSLEESLSHISDEQFIQSVNPTQKEVQQKQKDILHAMPYRQCFTDKGKNLLKNFNISSNEKDSRLYTTLQYDNNYMQKYFLLQNKDATTLQSSSSGGVIFEIVDLIRAQNGSCFGVMFADDFLSLKYVEINDSNKTAVQGSKYINSALSDENKQQIIQLLELRKKVVFIGRPCQCFWMRNRFRQYNNLILVELFCFGVPAENLWKDYASKLIAQNGNIKFVNFRDKKSGWHNYSFTMQFENGLVLSEPHSHNKYMHDYLSRKNFMQKCYSCQFKSIIKSQSDIICGDAWGIESNDDKGTSIVIANTQVGHNIIKQIENKFSAIQCNEHQLQRLKTLNNGFPRALLEFDMTYRKKPIIPPKLDFLNMPSIKEFDVIVSFATYKLRIDKGELYQSLDSIVNQKFNGKFHVVANLWKKDYEEAPQKLKDYFKEHDIEVILTDQNYKTHSKYCFVFEKYKGIPIATFDDDQIYRQDALQLLFDTYKRHPRTLIGGFCVIPNGIVDKKTGRRGKPRPPTGTPPARGIQIWGSGGNFYPPEFTEKITLGMIEDWIQKSAVNCKYDNDMYLFRMAKKFGFNGMVVECKHEKPTWRGYLVEKFLPTADDETAKTWNKP